MGLLYVNSASGAHLTVQLKYDSRTRRVHQRRTDDHGREVFGVHRQAVPAVPQGGRSGRNHRIMSALQDALSRGLLVRQRGLRQAGCRGVASARPTGCRQRIAVGPQPAIWRRGRGGPSQRSAARRRRRGGRGHRFHHLALDRHPRALSRFVPARPRAPLQSAPQAGTMKEIRGRMTRHRRRRTLPDMQPGASLNPSARPGIGPRRRARANGSVGDCLERSFKRSGTTMWSTRNRASRPFFISTCTWCTR